MSSVGFNLKKLLFVPLHSYMFVWEQYVSAFVLKIYIYVSAFSEEVYNLKETPISIPGGGKSLSLWKR